MTDLTRLKVSLTKHGAHKVARLLKNFPVEEVLDNTSDSFEKICIDRAQAIKNLSATKDGTLPPVWEKVQKLGEKAINNLVFIAVAFSHGVLIEALKTGASGIATGVLIPSYFPDRKSFTNFKNDIEELGLALKADNKHVSYDLQVIFNDERIGPLAAELFNLKLRTAGWDGRTDLIDECIRQGFNEALAVPEEFFRKWLVGGETQTERDENKNTDEENVLVSPFAFRSGHTKRKGGIVGRSSSGKKGTAELLHNELQEKLYKYLAGKNGKENVGTEVPSGVAGTSIDVVLKDDDKCIFYEIKTAGSVKSCIREALPQLLEYSYWPDEDRANQIVIVSLNRPTEDAKKYLKLLREKFGIPVYYQQIEANSGALFGPV